jgi:hypothetical protein
MHEQKLKVMYLRNISNCRQQIMYIINLLWGHHFSGRTVYCSEADGYASSSVTVGRATQAGQVSVEESDKVSLIESFGRLLEFAKPPKAAQHKLKACSSGFRFGYVKPFPPKCQNNYRKRPCK